MSKTEGGNERMLTMDKIDYIRSMEKFEDVSLREISRRTGHHFNTIKKYVDQTDFNEEKPKENTYPSGLDPLKPIIDKWLEDDLKAPRKQRHTAKRVFERLQEEYPDELDVKLRIVQYYVAAKKKELCSDKGKGYIPLEHSPGEAQVDFGEFVYYDNAGVQELAYNLTVSFPYSNGAYCQSFKAQNQECFLQGMKNIFEYVGFIPNRMVFDNLSAAVISVGKNGDRSLTEGFLRFKNHYGFQASFCNVRAGWEKGNVENKVGYERRNLFVPIPTITDFDVFNEELFNACNKDMKREHYYKKEHINELFIEDVQAMLPLPPTAYNVFKLVTAKADKYGKVMFDTNKYSTSPALALAQVYLEIHSTKIVVMNERYKVITVHNRIYGKGQESMDWQPYLDLMSRRPNAIKYTAFYRQLPSIWQHYLDESDLQTKKEALKVLGVMLEKQPIAIATSALSATLGSGVKDAASILSSYQRITNNTGDVPDIILSEKIPIMPTYQEDLSTYDALLGKAVL